MQFGLPQADLLGTAFEAIFYGAYAMVFIKHMHILYRRRSRAWSHLYLQATSITLFALMTTHMIIDIIRSMQAFTFNMDIPNAPILYFEHFNSFLSRMRTSVYNGATLVSDLFLVYRCFVIWGGNYLVALIPFLLFLVDIAMAVWATNSLNVAKSGDPFAATLVGLRSKYIFIVTLTLNLVCTALIAYRIWTIQKEVAPYMSSDNPRSLNRIIALMIESAAVYSALLIALIITDSVGSPVFFLILDFALVIPTCAPTNNPFENLVTGHQFRSGTPRASYDKTLSVKFTPHTIGSTTADVGSSGVHIQLESFRHPRQSYQPGRQDEDQELQKQTMDV
ncbi:hypothetical protein CVT26_000507 [Gymnopilus dilepis]|uniref:THH1/TOM1/TOM3 domain-containing protein n=1 Tax=Gymnopilus dilepis TaxID=231916 RepID=A0A409VH38_9AGAR|nr:hypothetical protein CVT26_000507 [Gymnopilus dilepis]